jgi:hypothetical protein
VRDVLVEAQALLDVQVHLLVEAQPQLGAQPELRVAVRPRRRRGQARTQEQHERRQPDQ